MSHAGFYSDLSSLDNVNDALEQAELYRDQSLQYRNEAEVFANDADTSADAAAASAVDAGNSAANALISENAALVSETNANLSAVAAAASAAAALASEQAAEATQVEIRNVYYGPSATEPTTRPDLSPSQAGDQYFNTTEDALYVFDGVDWISNDVTQFQDDLASSSGSNQIGFLQAGTGAVARTAQSKMRERISVHDFGAVGDGVADDTAAIQAAIDYAASVNGELYDRTGMTYKITSVMLKDGIRVFDMTQGTIKPTNACIDLNTAAIKMQGPNLYAGAAVRNCEISVRIDMSSGGLMPLVSDAGSDNTFKDCRIFGYVDHATLNHYGLIFWFGSNRNRIFNNSIVGVTNPTQRGLLIDFIGDGDDFGNYFAGSGVTTRATTPCLDNIVYGNVLTAGSYAINMLGAESTIVGNNLCKGQNHRSLYMAASCWNNVVGGNQFIDFLSTAVLVAYGCENNIICNNRCERDIGVEAAGTGEAVINLNTGAQRNLIIGNKIFADTNYGIYMACNTSFNIVKANEVRNYYLAGIALESDWEDTPPAGALYSRPNYAAPGTVSPGATQWSFNNCEGNEIIDNTIREGSVGRPVAAIYVAQIVSNTDLSVIKNNIRNNNVFGNADMSYYLYIYEETSGKLVNNKLSGNTWTDASGVPTASKIFLSRGRLHFNYQFNNDVIDVVTTTFNDGDTTPSVAYGGRFQFSNTGSTSITQFDDGVPGQVIEVRMDVNTTIVHNASLIRLASVQSVSGRNSNDFMTFYNASLTSTPLWVEQSRSFSLALVGQATYDPPNIIDAAGTTTTVTCTGAAVGDLVTGVSFTNNINGMIMTGWVSATDTVSVRIQNETGGSIDLGSGTLRVRVMKA